VNEDLGTVSAEVRPPLRKVLIVDDDASMREVVVHRLQEHGRYLPLQAEGRDDSLQIVKQNPDILAAFVDQRFADDDRGGLKILKEILKQRPLLPVILYTAAPVADIRREAYDAGALWYLPKVQITGPEDLTALLEIASKLVDVMPVDTDPRFLKQILDAVPTPVMVRDKEGRIVYQNRAKEQEYGPIVPGRTFCWYQYEGHKDDPADKCPGAEEKCACELVFSPRFDEDRVWPVNRIYEHSIAWTKDARRHGSSWSILGATGILGRDGKPQYAVEAARGITQLVETLKLITDIANQYELSEDGALQLASQRLVERVGFTRARVWKFDPKTRSFVCTAAVGKHQGEVVGKRITWPDEQLAKLAEHRPIRVSKVELTQVLPQDVVQSVDPADTCLWAPFYVGGDLAGLIVVDRKGQKSEHIWQLDEYWMGFVGQDISALVEIKRRRKDLEWLEELDRRISGIDTVAEVLRIVIDGLREQVNADLIQFHQLAPDGKTIRLDAKREGDAPLSNHPSSLIIYHPRRPRAAPTEPQLPSRMQKLLPGRNGHRLCGCDRPSR
jgi:CheY-like chemotaxis protein